MLDEEVRSSLAQQQRQGVDRLLRNELCARLDIEVARAADAQATKQRRTSNMLARLQLLEAEQRAAILPNQRQERDGVTREAGWAKRHREMSVWEDRCRIALLGWGNCAGGRWPQYGGGYGRYNNNNTRAHGTRAG